jgi:hypothetical protein
MEHRDDPEILAVVPLPSAAERRRREISMNGVEIAVSMVDSPDLSEHRRKELALVLLMDAAIEVLLNTGEDGLDIRVETARDLVRELKCVYPETREI